MIINQINSLFELDFPYIFYQSTFHYANYFLKKREREREYLQFSLASFTSLFQIYQGCIIQKSNYLGHC